MLKYFEDSKEMIEVGSRSSGESNNWQRLQSLLGIERYRLAVIICISFSVLIVGIQNKHGEDGDERFYIGAARDFISGAESMNPEHPPLAKYFIAASIKAFGNHEFGWRLPSALAGTLLAVAIFGMARRLADTRTAWLAWLFTITGGFWYMMSRLAMLSVYEFAFEVAAIWIFLVALDTDEATAWCGAGILFGLAVASRWMGAMGLITCMGFAFYRRRALKPCAMGVIAFATYCLTWIPLLIREHRSARYLVDANLFILNFHHNLLVIPRVQESWWTWLLPASVPRSALFVANPIIGACGLLALGAAIVFRKRQAYLPALLYAAHMLPWMTSIRPMTYYYYYFEAYTFLAIVLAIVVSRVTLCKVRVDVMVAAAAVGYCVYWFPMWGQFPPPFGGVFGYH